MYNALLKEETNSIGRLFFLRWNSSFEATVTEKPEKATVVVEFWDKPFNKIDHAILNIRGNFCTDLMLAEKLRNEEDIRLYLTRWIDPSLISRQDLQPTLTRYDNLRASMKKGTLTKEFSEYASRCCQPGQEKAAIINGATKKTALACTFGSLVHTKQFPLVDFVIHFIDTPGTKNGIEIEPLISTKNNQFKFLDILGWDEARIRDYLGLPASTD